MNYAKFSIKINQITKTQQTLQDIASRNTFLINHKSLFTNYERLSKVPSQNIHPPNRPSTPLLHPIHRINCKSHLSINQHRPKQLATKQNNSIFFIFKHLSHIIRHEKIINIITNQKRNTK